MPWFPWPDFIKKRACRYLLQHYLGAFLQEKLQLEQLSVDLYNGTGIVRNVSLDIYSINEQLKQMNSPFEMLEGTIGSISVYIPWSAILKDNCLVKVDELKVVLQPRLEADCSRSFMTNSFYQSVRSMTTSMEIAKECFKEDMHGNESKNDPGKLFEGMELFAQTIDSVLSRIKLSFANTTVRFESVMSHTGLVIGIELLVEKLDYFDEVTMTSNSQTHLSNGESHDPNSDVNIKGCKHFCASGIKLKLDHYQEVSENISPYGSNNYAENLASDSDSKSSSVDVCTTDPIEVASKHNSVEIAHFFDTQEVKLRYTSSSNLESMFIDVECFLGSCCIFLTPNQVQLILTFFSVFASDNQSPPVQQRMSPVDFEPSSPASCGQKNKLINPEDFQKIEKQIIAQQLGQDLGYTNDLMYEHKSSTNHEKERFFSLSMAGSTTLDDLPTKPRSFSFESENETGSETTQSSHSGSHNTRYAERFDAQNRGMNQTPDSSLHIQVRFNHYVATILHIDPIGTSTQHAGSTNTGSTNLQETSSPSEQSAAYLMQLSTQHFSAVSSIVGKLNSLTVEEKRCAFSCTCNGHDHLRLVLSPLHVDVDSTKTKKSTHQLAETSINASIGYGELLECLAPGNFGGSISGNPGTGDSMKSSCLHSELLVFNTPLSSHGSSSSQAVKLETKWSTVKDITRTTIHLSIASCQSEIDISIVDRLNALLSALDITSKQSATSNVYSSTSGRSHTQHNAYKHVLDENKEKTKVSIDISSPNLKIVFRFPIPDLRPEMERKPWFTQSLRDEMLVMVAVDTKLLTTFCIGGNQHVGNYGSNSHNEKQSFFIQSRDIQVLYVDECGKAAKPFLRTFQMKEDSSFNSDLDMPHIRITIHPELIRENLLENKKFYSKNAEHGDLDSYSDESDDITDDISAAEPTPFSCRRVIYNSEEVVMPGDTEELQRFVDRTFPSAHVAIELNFPQIHILLPSKTFFESLYNRINNDLLLWQPMAPQPTSTSADMSNTILIPPRLDLASQGFFSQGASVYQIANSYRFKMCNSLSKVSMDSDDSDNEPFTSKHHHSPSIASRQSVIALNLSIGNGKLTAYTSILDPDSDGLATGEIILRLETGTLFHVSGFLGNPNLDYMCAQVGRCTIYHRNDGSMPTKPADLSANLTFPSSQPVLDFSKDGVMQSFTGNHPDKNATLQSMLTLALKIEIDEKRPMKQCVVAAIIHGATLHYTFTPPGYSWLEQIVEFVDITDTSVLGYVAPSFLTELHIHAENSSVEYRPLNLPCPQHVFCALKFFSMSSNVAADSPLSVFRFVIDDGSLYIAEVKSVNCELVHDFVRVIDVGLLEITFKVAATKLASASATPLKRAFPLIDLMVTNNKICVQTCADSCVALTSLIQYLAEDGDLSANTHLCSSQSSLHNSASTASSIRQASDQLRSSTTLNSSASGYSQTDDDSDYEDTLSDLVADAMVDIDVKKSHVKHGAMQKSVYHPRSQTSRRPLQKMSASFPVKQLTKALSYSDDDEFCIIDEPDIQIVRHHDEPEVCYLNSFNKIEIAENYFRPVLGKIDQLRSPPHFPTPVIRYTIAEMSCVWHMFGGSDFLLASSPKHNSAVNSPSRNNIGGFRAEYNKNVAGVRMQRTGRNSPVVADERKGSHNGGGRGRNGKVVMEIHLTKVRFQHEIYDVHENEAARTVVIVNEFEVRDRLVSSQINKFLYRFHSESSPKQSHANMLLIKALQVRSEGEAMPPECRLRVSLQPLRFNVDQDSLEFLTEFFGRMSQSPDDGDFQDANLTTFGSPTRKESTPTMNHQFSVDTQHSDTEGMTNGNQPLQGPDLAQPLFFREFIFSPEVPIRLDYHGKHVDIEQGTLAGLLMGLGQLKCSQLKLRRLVYRQGLLGPERVASFALSEWAADIRKNQLPSILGGVGPLHSVVQFFQGVRDLLWMPVEQYQRDGRIMRGVQRGTASFGASTAMASLEIANRFVYLIQRAAETTYDVVTPSELDLRLQRNWHTLGSQASSKRQPSDLREGLNNAMTVMCDGVHDTAYSIARVAQEQHEHKGLTGAVGGVLRHIPPTLVRPVIIASQATSNVLCGMRNQILPDARREDEDKWRRTSKEDS